jgi:hypothetical protein
VSTGLYWEQIVFEFFIEGRILAANPFQHHCRMFFFLVAVMGEDCSQLVVSTCIDPLAIPVNRFKSFHQRDDRTMHIARFITDFGNGFVIAFVRRIRVPYLSAILSRRSAVPFETIVQSSQGEAHG